MFIKKITYGWYVPLSFFFPYKSSKGVNKRERAFFIQIAHFARTECILDFKNVISSKRAFFSVGTYFNRSIY